MYERNQKICFDISILISSFISSLKFDLQQMEQFHGKLFENRLMAQNLRIFYQIIDSV